MLLDSIITLQRKKGLTDAAFCRALGINQPNWNRIKAGSRPVDSPGFPKALLAVYPELGAAVLTHLSRDGGERNAE